MIGAVTDAFATVNAPRFRNTGLAAPDAYRFRWTMAGATDATDTSLREQPD